MARLFGLFTRATYDLTKYATLKDWPVKPVFIDTLGNDLDRAGKHTCILHHPLLLLLEPVLLLSLVLLIFDLNNHLWI